MKFKPAKHGLFALIAIGVLSFGNKPVLTPQIGPPR